MPVSVLPDPRFPSHRNDGFHWPDSGGTFSRNNHRVIPYHPAEYLTEIPEGYDGTFYPFGMENVPRRFAIPRANRSMIETCDYLIAYVTHTASNAHRFLEYARRREKKGLLHIVNLADAMANH